MGGLKSFFKGSKATTTYDPYGTWNPEQIALGKSLGTNLNTLTSNVPSYTGDYTTPLTSEEQAVLSNQNRLNAMTEDWSSKFQPGYIDPEVDRIELANLNRAFYGDALNPGAKALAEEQFAGNGGYWGDARAKGIMGTYANTVTNPYNTWRSNALQNSYQNALNYATNRTNLNTANAQLQQVPRLITQYGLDKKYAEWIRGEESKRSYVDAALTFLNIGSKTATYTPAKQSGFQALAKSGILGVGGGVLADATSGNGEWTATEGSSQAAINAIMNAIMGG